MSQGVTVPTCITSLKGVVRALTTSSSASSPLHPLDPLPPFTIGPPPSVGTPASCRLKFEGSKNREAEVLDPAPDASIPTVIGTAGFLLACSTVLFRVGTPASTNIDDSRTHEAEVPDCFPRPTPPACVVVGSSFVPHLSCPPVVSVLSILVARVVRPVNEATHVVDEVVPPAGRVCSLVPAARGSDDGGGRPCGGTAGGLALVQGPRPGGRREVGCPP